MTEIQTQFTEQLIASRQTVLPKRLTEPSPSEEQLSRLFLAASAAPDHGQIMPWRFLIIPKHKRGELGNLFAAALLERDAAATVEQVAAAHDKALRSPFLMLLIVDEGKLPREIDIHERVLSAGCAIQNMLLLATAMGYGTSLTSGKALKLRCLRDGLGLSASEHAICFLSIGTTGAERPLKRRPSTAEFMKIWGEGRV